MAKRKQDPIFLSCYKITEYLKKNTDKNHPTTQAQMRKDKSIVEFLGAKETSNSYINQIALTLNSDENGDLKKEKYWKVNFDAFTEVHAQTDGKKKKKCPYVNEDKLPIRNLYYNQEFSEDDIDKIIESIQLSDVLSEKMQKKLIKKIKEELATVFYQEKTATLKKLNPHINIEYETFRKNISVIEEAIKNNVMVSFYFNKVGEYKRFERVSITKEVVSPYYLAEYNGRYYLIASKESFMGKNFKRTMSVWRVDLMTEVRIPGKNETQGILGDTATPKEKITDLPQEWTEDFLYKHINFSPETPVEITMRLHELNRIDDISKTDTYGLTFLSDAFGETYEYKKTRAGDVLVKVKTSPTEIVDWAIAHSNRVEVTEPEFVRKNIAERVKELNKIYNS